MHLTSAGLANKYYFPGSEILLQAAGPDIHSTAVRPNVEEFLTETAVNRFEIVNLVCTLSAQIFSHSALLFWLDTALEGESEVVPNRETIKRTEVGTFS